ncbi:hypothetical protein [Enteroscipio rubneri]|uniref:hypothetical protein n=1 Tax=Enteroscipio rubneri TaxID=2070686 RepID=UPI00195893AC|nr:hypothetical protein [Enteroscipio rubneri]
MASGETVSVIKADGTAKDVVLPTYDASAGGLQIGTAEQLALFTYLNMTAARKMETSSIDASKQNRELSAVLANDINLVGTEYSQTSGTPLAWTPIVTTQHGEVSANYAGTFDGQGHTISNLTKTGSVTGQSGWGLFGFVSAGGTVKNVLLKDVNINVTSDDYLTVGGIASQLTGGAVVESCGVLSGTIGKDPTANRLTGGIVGDLYIGGGTIKNCFSNATMLGNQSGGILGRSISTGTHTLENCYFTGVATNAMIAARTATTSVTNCYSTSDATLDAGTKITSDQLKTWGAAYQLNGGATGGTGATGNVADMATWRMDDPANPKNGGFPVLCAAGETMDKASDWQDVGEWVESFNPNDVNGQAMKPAGDGADATPFLISTPEALAWLGIEVEAHNRNHKISATLLGDIDLAGTRYGGSIDESAATAEAKYHNALPWIPIGRTVAFGGGTFNGQNFTIEHMNAAAYEDVSYAFSGLFAKTDGAVLRDVSLRSGVVLMENLGESNLYVGSLAGVIDSGTNVVNCVNESVDVVVRGHEADDAEIGGLVGSVQSSSLYGCRNEGNVTTNEPSRDANGFAGGIAGGADAGKMLLCFNSGTLTSTGYPEADGLGCMYVGGILGGAPGRSAKTQIIQCGNIGSVAPTGASYAAGIVSLVSWDASDTNLQIASNYSAGPIGVAASEDPSKVYAICPNYIASLGGVSMNAYCTVNTDVLVAYELNDANFGNILGKTTAEMQGSALLSDLNIKLYAYTGTDDPKAPSGDLLYNIYEWTNAPDHNGYPIPSLKASSSAYADWGTVGTAIRAKQADLTAGSATISAGLADPLGNSPTTLVPQVQKEADGTLLISTPEQLAWFQASIDADSGTWAGKNVKLTADLDLSGTKYGGKVNSTATTDKDKYATCLPWTPIGGMSDTSATATPAKAYTGTFDGGRHAITNLAPVKRGYHVGLFGIAHNATLRGVNVASGYIAGVDRAAGVVARITGITTVEDCSNAATVYSDPSNAGGGSGTACNTGGVVGCAYMGDTFYIRRCSNTGDVRAIRDAGGVIGSTNCTNPGIIEDSYNTGNITATANSGGYGTGGVIGTGGNVSRMARCYNAGDVNGSKKGALSDSFTSGATVESCYYDGSKAGATGSGTSLTSDQLKTWGTAYQLNGGATGGTQSGNVAGMNTWTFAPDSYPQLIARNADGSPAASMQKASDWGQVGEWVENFCTATDTGETAGFKPNLSTNNGTATDKPITLTTPEALAWYAYKLNTNPTETISGTTTYADAHVKLSAPSGAIDLTGEPYGGSFDASAATAKDKHRNVVGWVPMGTRDNPFAGTFTAKGTNIERFHIPGRNNPGLFECGSDATLSDVTIASGYFNHTGGVAGGSLMAYATGDVTMTDCRNAAEGHGAGSGTYLGGLMGKSLGGSVTMSRCMNQGDLQTESNYAAGLLVDFSSGSSGKLSVSDCGNTGAQAANAGVAGLVVNMRTNSPDAGALSIVNSYNFGPGTETGVMEMTNGAIYGGVSSGNLLVSNCYYNSTIEGHNDGGATPKTPVEFASGEVAWLLNAASAEGVLNESVPVGRDVWNQRIDRDPVTGEFQPTGGLHPTLDWMPATLHPLVRATIRLQGAPLARAAAVDSYEYANEGSMLALPAGYSKYYMGSLGGPEISNPYFILSHTGDFMVYAKGISSWADVAASASEAELRATDTGSGLMALSGSGSASQPYIISSPEALAWFAYQVNTKNADSIANTQAAGGSDPAFTAAPGLAYGAAHARLGADIDLTGPAGSASATPLPWVPIGWESTYTGTSVYTGSFDGKGHTIDHMWVGTDGEAGLFGRTGSGTIANLALGTNSSVRIDAPYAVASKHAAGGLVAVADGTHIEGCLSGASVTANLGVRGSSGAANEAAVGGLVGVFANPGSIERSANTGAVSSEEGVPGAPTRLGLGGLVGDDAQSGGGTSIDGCFNSGAVTIAVSYGDLSFAGGLVGKAFVPGDLTEVSYRGTTVTDSYNTGAIAVSSSAGSSVSGLSVDTVFPVGRTRYADAAAIASRAVSNVLTLDTVVGAEVGSMGGVSGAGTVTNLLGAKSVSAGQLNTWGAAYELNGGATGGTAGDGAVATMDKWGILSGASSPMPVIQGSTAAAASMPAASSWEDVGSWVDNFDPVDERGNKFKPDLLVSDGSAALKPIQLGSSEALAWMACKVNYDNGGKPVETSTLTYGTSFYQLTDDVSLAGTKYTDGTVRLDWLGIGSLGSPFGGAFAGGSHAVDGLSVVSTRNYQGFFGYMSAPEGAAEKASVHDLSLSGSVSGGECVGGLLGQGVNVRLSNLSVRVDVTGSDNVGGVVGRLETSSEGSAVSHTGTVGATVGCAGGFVGNSVSTVLTDVSHVGSVSAPDKAGGIGAVYGSFRSCSLTNAYVAGTVKVNAGGLSYALVGDTYNTNLANCYFDEAAGPSLAHPTSGMASATNVEAKTADEFASGEVAWLLDTASADGATTGNAHRNVWGQNVGRNADGQLDATAGDAYPVAGVSAAHPCVLKIDQDFDATAFPGESTQTTYASAGSKVKLAVVTDASKKLKYVLAGNELGDSTTGETTIKSPYTVHASRTADLSITAKNGAVFDSWESLATAVDTGQTVTMLDGTPRNMGEYKNIDGAGTAADPYQIDSPEAFAWWAFKKASNTATSHAVLTQGISLFGNDYVDAAPGPDAKNVDGNDGADGIPDNIREALPWPGTASLGEYPGSGSNTGSLDGGGNAVSHLYVASGDGGLFRSVAAGAVRNLVMDAGLVDSDGYAAGSVAAVATNSVFVNVANESVEVRKVGAADDIRGAGGLVGYTGGAGTIATFVNCANKADVSSGKHAGGIIGAADAGGTFYLCSNEGDVSGTSAGGLTSNIGSDACNGFVEACSNTGAIASTAGAAAGLACADRFASFKNSYSAAAVTAAGGTAYALADAGTLTDCYFDQDAFRSATTPGASGATAKTSDEMKAPGFAADLNVALSASATQSEGVALNKYQWMQAADGNTNKGYPYTAARVYADWGDVGADQTETTLRASGALTGGKGANESDAVVINSPEALAWLAKQVNSGGDIFAGGSEGYMAIQAYVKLGADLSLKGTKASGAVDDYVAADHRGLPWVSMGTSSYPFQGTFDGCGHEVDYVTVAEGGSPEGFFGYVSGTVKNMGIGANSKMTSGGTSASIAGALVQRLQGGTVDGCWNKGDVSLTGNKVGGLIGQASGTLKNSWNEGSVSCSNQYAGGLVGLVGRGDDLVVENCYNKGNLSNSNTIAGLVTAESGATVRFSNCYNAGEVRAGNAGALYVNDAGNAAGATFTNCYYEEGKVVYVDPQDATAAGLTSMTAAQLKSWGAAYQLNGGATGGTAGDGNVANMSTWTFDVANPGYPALIARNASGMATAAMSKAADWSDVGAWVENFNPSTSDPLKKFKPAGDGSTGAFNATTDTGPYQITTPEGLAWFAYKVNNDNAAFGSKSAAVPEGSPAFDLAGVKYGGQVDAGASSDEAKYANALAWEPVAKGVATVSYKGDFDGGLVPMKNLYVPKNASSTTNLSGLFCSVSGSTIKRTVVESGYAASSTVSAGIAAQAENATFEQCSSGVSLNGYYQAGGIVGNAVGTLSVKDCLNEGALMAGTERGGIVGAARDAASITITNCSNVYALADGQFDPITKETTAVSFANNYYLSGGSASTYGTAKTADEFASGEVAWLLDTASPDGTTTGGAHRNVWGQKVGRDATTGELAAGGDAYPAFLDAAAHPCVLKLAQDFDNGVFGDDIAEPSQASYANAGSKVKLAVPTDPAKKVKYVLSGNEEGSDSTVETVITSPYTVHDSRTADLAITVKNNAVFESWAKLADAVDTGDTVTLTNGDSKNMGDFKPTNAGTVGDPYQLSTPEAFAWWAYKSTGADYAVLTADISLFGETYIEATPGVDEKDVDGNPGADGIPDNIREALPWPNTTTGVRLDGGDFTVEHLYATVGLLKDAVDVRNLTLAKGLVDASGQATAWAGAFASTGAANAVFANLVNESVSVRGLGGGDNRAGGIVGGGQDQTTFVACTNRASVKGSCMVGGIQGCAAGEAGTSLSFYLCSNEGAVESDTSSDATVGGIDGGTRESWLYGCSNTGDLVSQNEAYGFGCQAMATNCYNGATVSVRGGGGYTFPTDAAGGPTVYYDKEKYTEGINPSSATGMLTTEMQSKAFATTLNAERSDVAEVAGIDLTEYRWMFDPTVNKGYPHIAKRVYADWGDVGADQDEGKLRLTYWDDVSGTWKTAADASAVPSGMAALEGTATDGFTIRSEEALAWFGAQVNAGATGFASANVTLVAAGSHTAFDLAGTAYGHSVDSALSEADVVEAEAKYKTALLWVPIGTETNPFTGTLRAYGTEIQNIVVFETPDNNRGLFGAVNGAELAGVEVASGLMRRTVAVYKGKNTGGIVGVASGVTKLVDCENAAVSSGGPNGGLVGLAKSAELSIVRSGNRGLVDVGMDIAGGLVGLVDGGSCTITDGYNRGKVSVNGDGCGFVGALEGGATLRLDRCYNAGYLSTAENSFMFSPNEVGVGEDCFYDATVNPRYTNSAGLKALTTAQLQTWGAAYQLNGGASGGAGATGNVADMSTWTFDAANPGYPELIARDASGAATAAMSKAGSWSDVGLWVETFNPSTATPLEKFKPAGDGSTGAFDAATNTGPYQITTSESLAWFAYMVGSQPDAYRSKSVELMSDINLEGAAYGGYLDVPAFGADASDAYKTCLPWDPIGGVSDRAVRYAGSFDGGGHDVLNVRIDGERYGHPYALGIFGFLEGAAVRNLALKSGLVQTSASSSYSGAIAGNVDGAHLSDVVNEGVRVLEGYCTGGLVGNARGASSAFEQCGNETQVTCGTAYQYTGGLVGRVEAGGTSFVDCANAGEVSGASINGGIVGYCAVGGVALASCLNTGRVATSGGYAGNFLGDGSGGITLANCYYLQGACAPNGSEGASVAKTADEFASGEVAWLLDTASANGATTGGPHRNVWGQKVGRDATTGELTAGGDAYPAFLDAAVHPRVLALTQDFDNGVFGDDTAEPSQTSYANAGSMVKLAVPTDSTKKIKYVLAGNEEGNDSAVETTLESPYLVHSSRATDLAIAVKNGAVFESWAKLADAVDAAPGTETTLTDGTKKDMSTYKPAGAGTVDDPYQLSTPEAFAWWAFKKGGHAKLTANISLFGDNYVGATPGALDADGIPGNIKNALPWTGITVGTNLDGGNFTITHLYGTTGLLSEAVDLRNLTLAEGLVDATGQTNAQVGAFASTSSDTNAVFVNLTNQSVAVFGSGDSSNGYAGGIAGSSVGTPSFVNCTNRAPVSSAHWTGGILGGMKGLPDTVAPQFYLCSNEADIDVSSTAYSIGGGIAGSAYKGDMEACSNTGAISAAGDCAGLVVSEPALTGRNCYNAGAVSGATYSNDQFGGGTYQDSYYNSAFAAPTLGGGTPKSSAEMKDAAFAADLDRVLVQSTTEVAGIKLARYQWMYDSTVNSGYPHIAERPITNWGDAGAAQDEAKLRLTYWDNATSAWTLAANASAVPSGMAALEGTATDGFTIRSEEALAWFGAQVNAGATGFASANVTLVAAGSHTAFDLAGTAYGFDVTAGGADDKAKYSTCLPWVPIGTEANPFAGTLRAYGSPIQSLYIGAVDDDVHGLFGTVDGATLLGVEVSDGYVQAGKSSSLGCAGIVAGQTLGTVVLEDCHNAATVRGDKTGGLVGRVLSGSLTVRTSSNEGKVEIQGGQPVGGGLVGAAKAPVQISDSYNVGTVEGDWSVGGLIGLLETPASASFDRCFSAGNLVNIHNADQKAAFAYTIQACPITIGEGCYYDSDVISGTQDAASVTGLTTAQLKTWGAAYQLNGGAAGGTGATGNVADMSTWRMAKDSSENGGYPVLFAISGNGATSGTMQKPADWSVVGAWVDDFNPSTSTPLKKFKPAGDGSTGAFNATTDTGPYQITTPEGLAWFAYKVNNDNAAFGSKSAAVPEGSPAFDLAGVKYGGQVDAGASSDSDKYVNALDWVPIGFYEPGGTSSLLYQGSFDGGLVPVRSLSTVTRDISGLFGFTGDASIKRVVVESGYLSNNGAGGIVVEACASKTLVIEQCANGATVEATFCSGGVVGQATGTVRMRDCYNWGQASRGYARSGLCGNVKSGGTLDIANCYSTFVSALTDYDSIVMNDGGTVVGANNYYLSGGRSAHGMAKNAADFRSGEVAWLLDTASTDGASTGNVHRNMWGQKVGRDADGVVDSSGDAYPALGITDAHPRVLALTQDFDAALGDDTVEPTQTAYANAGTPVALAKSKVDSTKALVYRLTGNDAGTDPSTTTIIGSPYTVDASRDTDLDIAVIKPVFDSWEMLADAIDSTDPGVSTITLPNGKSRDMSVYKPTDAGTEADPYQIDSPEALAWWAYKSTGYAVLTDNMSLFGADYMGAVPGTDSKDVDGNDGADGIPDNIREALPWPNTTTGAHLDGGGFTISHLYATNGLLKGAVDVRNLTLSEGLVDAAGQSMASAGAFASTVASGAIFANLVNQSVAVRGSGDAQCIAGGIVGEGTDAAVFMECVNRASVGMSYYASGIMGLSYSSLHVQFYLCANEGTVDVSDVSSSRAVGITASRDFDAEACYNTGSVEADFLAAGLFGATEASIKNCYNSGTVASTSGRASQIADTTNSSLPKITVESSYYNSDLGVPASNVGTFGTPRSAADMQTDGFVDLLDDVLAKSKSEAAGIKLARYQWTRTDGTNKGYPYTVAGRAFSNWGEVGADQDEAELRTTAVVGSENGFALSGEGSEASPYVISSPEAFAWYAHKVNNSGRSSIANSDGSAPGLTYNKAYVNLGANIDLLGKPYGGKADETQPTAAQKYANVLDWIPISNVLPHFDGKGHTISHLYINAPDKNDQGLFGKADEYDSRAPRGFVKNTSVDRTSYVYGGDSVAAIVGYTRGGVVDIVNCSNAAEVKGSIEVSGIVGQGAYSCIIIGCANTGDITGTTCVSGIVGSNTSSIMNCYNTGAITASGSSDWAGGISANGDGKIVNCYNAGPVKAADAGAIDGSGRSNCYNCFYDKDASTPSDAAAGSVVGVVNKTDVADKTQGVSGAELKSWGAAYQLSRVSSTPNGSGEFNYTSESNVANMAAWRQATGSASAGTLENNGYPVLVGLDNVAVDGGVVDHLQAASSWVDVATWVDTFLAADEKVNQRYPVPWRARP